MRALYLLRHAKSSWGDPALADHERPLSARGRRDAERIARHVSSLAIEPELVLCSSACRARETLELAGRGFAAPVRARFEPALYAASAGELLGRLHRLPDEVDSVMLIGHNPGLHDLALGLARAGEERKRLQVKFPTGALATLSIPAATWRELGEGLARLSAFVVPRQLG
jgi:phosphohistidine phosphatase